MPVVLRVVKVICIIHLAQCLTVISTEKVTGFIILMNHGCTCVPILNLPLNSIPIPSLRVVLVHQLWVPCLCIKLGLVIYFTYGNMHVLMLFSHIVPLSCSIGLYFCFWASTILSWWLNEVAQLCLTLCDPMDYSLPGSSVHGIFQARVLKCIANSFSNDDYSFVV